MNTKIIRRITEIIAIITICLISFIGVYIQKGNTMENTVKKYDLNKELKGYRELVFKVSDANKVLDKDGKVIGDTNSYSDSTIESNSYTKSEEKVNSEEALNAENYEKAKKIIENRLQRLGCTDYNLSQNIENGEIYLQLPENSETSHTVTNILQVASFSIKDSKDNEKVFVTNEQLKKAGVVYNTEQTGTTVYLRLDFDNKGKEILKDISTGEYAKKEENKEEESETENNSETEENKVDAETTVSTEEKNEQQETTEEEEHEHEENETENDNKEEQKEITLSIDNNSMVTSSFADPIETGSLNLSMNQASKDEETINETIKSASTVAILLNSGTLPITYKIDKDVYVDNQIQNNVLQYTIYGLIGFMAIIILYFIIKYKIRGLIAGISYVGFLALYLLLVRYTNVAISYESIVAVCIMLILNFITSVTLLKIRETDKEINKKLYFENLKNITLKTLPILIISIVFAFMKYTPVSIFGMFMFWGIVLMIIYNFLLTRDLIS